MTICVTLLFSCWPRNVTSGLEIVERRLREMTQRIPLEYLVRRWRWLRSTRSARYIMQRRETSDSALSLHEQDLQQPSKSPSFRRDHGAAAGTCIPRKRELNYWREPCRRFRGVCVESGSPSRRPRGQGTALRLLHRPPDLQLRSRREKIGAHSYHPPEPHVNRPGYALLRESNSTPEPHGLAWRVPLPSPAARDWPCDSDVCENLEETRAPSTGYRAADRPWLLACTANAILDQPRARACRTKKK